MHDTNPTARSALVLAGGGTKGAFEVGVIEYLVDERGLRPGIITSASAGSILGLVLAQARTPEELHEAVAELHLNLMSMTRTDQVFGRQPWLEAFAGTPLGATIDGYLTQKTRPPVPGGVPECDPPRPGKASRNHLTWRQFTTVLEEIPTATKAFHSLKGHTSSILTLDPLESALRGLVEGASGLDDADIRPIDTSRVAEPGVTLRMAVTALGEGEVQYVGNDGAVFGPDASTAIRGRRAVDAIEGALASSSVPFVFPPRPIGEESYVDGGLLQNIPLEAALSLGAEEVHSVVAAPLSPPPVTGDLADMNLVGILLRCTAEIGFAETQRRNLAVPLGSGVTHHVHAPTIDVVGPFEVQQGLMLIDVDYGRMRAEETCAELDGPARAVAMDATDRLVVARERAWYLEERCLEAGSVGPDRERSLRALKEHVASCVAERCMLGLAEPPGSQRWVHGYETHSVAIPESFPQL